MSIKQYFQNFVDFGVYKTVVFETTCIYVMLLKFAPYPDWGKVGKANMRQLAGKCLMLARREASAPASLPLLGVDFPNHGHLGCNVVVTNSFIALRASAWAWVS